MGGCCCSSSKGVGLSSPAFYHYPSVFEEHEPLSSHHGTTVSALATGLLVDTNLETSIPDTYRPPPPPLPYEANTRRSQTPPRNQERFGNKNDATNTEETDAANTFEASDKGLNGSDCKVQNDTTELDSSNDTKVELEKSGELKRSSKLLVSALEEEDVCPTCLEGYDAENPKIITKCEHHFHLACILEWMERSDTCAICDQEMIFSPTVVG